MNSPVFRRLLGEVPRDLTPGDPQSTSYFVRILAWGIILLFTGYSFPVVSSNPELMIRWMTVTGLAFLISTTALVLVKLGHPKAAATTLVFSLWSLVSGASFTAGGMTALAVLGYFPIVLMAGLLLGSRLGTLTTILTLVFTGSMVSPWGASLVPPPIEYTLTARWGTFALFLGLFAVLQMIAGEVIRKSIQRARTELQHRTESEEKLRTFFDQSVNGVALTDEEGIVIEWNHAMESFLGIPRQEAIGKPLPPKILNILGADPGEESSSESRARRPAEMLKRQIHPIVRTAELEYRRDDGSIVHLYQSIFSFRSASGVRFGTVLSDNTARKKAEDEARALNEQLERRVRERTAQLEVVNEELAAFSYSVSHDLRAPIRTIDGFAGALQEDYADKLDEEGKSYLERVRASARRMNQIVEDLLRLSKVTTAPIDRQLVDVTTAASNILETLVRSNPRRRVSWTVQPGLVTFADAGLLEIVLENILANAWKFTGRLANASISVSGAEESGETIVHVRDNGAGFEMAQSHRLFKAFSRLHAASAFEGTGIGLATVKKIVLRHGGRIWAESRPDHGATFSFAIPTRDRVESSHIDS